MTTADKIRKYISENYDAIMAADTSDFTDEELMVAIAVAATCCFGSK